MINAGAMATLALVESDLDVSERFAKVEQTWARMMGRPPGFDHRTFLAERDTGHGNRGLASLMAAQDMLNVDPKDRDGPQKAAEFYFAVCSLEVDAQRLAAAGATLANGGVAPYTGERVFSQETAGRVLSVMGHSGMYNDSGRVRRPGRAAGQERRLGQRDDGGPGEAARGRDVLAAAGRGRKLGPRRRGLPPAGQRVRSAPVRATGRRTREAARRDS